MKPPEPRINIPPATEERGIPFRWYDPVLIASWGIFVALVLWLT
jgi:hypothetical protein